MASVASLCCFTSAFLFIAVFATFVHQSVSEAVLTSESIHNSKQLSDVPVVNRKEVVSPPPSSSSKDDDGSNSTGSIKGNGTQRKSFLQRYRQTLLTYHLKRSTHKPVCILFRHQESDINLEENISMLWTKLSAFKSFQGWKIGVYHVDDGPLRGFSIPGTVPALRCYVGGARHEDFSGKLTLRRLLQWFKMMGERYRNRIIEADVDSLRHAVMDESKLILLAFPGEERHFEVEWMLLEMKSTYKDALQLFVVHPGSVNESSLETKFNIKIKPVILAFKKGDQHLRVQQRFEDPLAEQRFLEPFVLSQTSSALSLTVNNFQGEVFRGSATPILVCFYTHWAEGVVRYLHTFLKSMDVFKEHGAKLRFGIVDVETEQDIVPRWLHAPGIQGMPFSILFWKKGKSLHQIALPEGANTPMAIATFLQEHDVTLRSVHGGSFHYPTWVEESSYDLQVSMGESSLIAPTCITGVNTSLAGVEDIWSEGPPDVKVMDRRPVSAPLNNLHNDKSARETNDLLTQKDNDMQRIGSIDQLTDENWSMVIDKSHAGMKPDELQELINIHKTSRKRDVPQTNLVFFIQDGCGSCRRQQSMFERVARAVKFVDGGSAYILNCTSDPVTCGRHNVRGFPTVIAFRTFGQYSSERCLSADHHQHTLRMDYHGVLQEKELLEWFSDIALPRVQVKTHQDVKIEQKHTNVILLATIYPLSLAGQYLRSVGGVDSWYPLDCFQVACERLYGKAKCYAVYSENIRSTDRERTRNEERLIVGKVEMLRQDGVTSKIITSGRSLIASLQAEADSQIHRFHTPHRYKLRSGQRCEDDHASCTDLITEFVEDHSRLPVTHLTMTSFHAYSSVGFDSKHKGSVFKSGLPVLIAFASKDHMEEGALFQQALQAAAYDLYQDVVFTWVDVDEFPRWVARFVPVYYQRLILEHEDEITDDLLPSLFVYPRLCLVRPDDHRHAAFYPSAKGFSLTSKLLGRTVHKEDILMFAQNFKKNPDEMLMDTEHF